MTQLERGPSPVEKTTVTGLRRSTEDRMIAGVCGGMGRYFGVDPVWFRLAFVVLTFGGGAGILIYLVAWLMIPKGESEASTQRPVSELGGQGAMVAGVVLVGIGLMLLVNNLVPWFDKVMWPLAVIAIGVGLLFMGGRNEQS